MDSSHNIIIWGGKKKPLKDITIDNDVLAKLKERAELDDRSLSQYTNIILKQHIKAMVEKTPWIL